MSERQLPGGRESTEPVEWALRDLQGATDLRALLAAEAQAAAAYWQAWSALSIPFPPAGRASCPSTG